MQRFYRGNVPINGKLMGQHGYWNVYDMVSKDARFFNVKVVCLQERAKANYWIGYDKEAARVVRGKDCRLLEKHAPEVFQWMCVLVAVAAKGANT